MFTGKKKQKKKKATSMWVALIQCGMRQFGMIYPHGIPPFGLGIGTGPFSSPLVPQFSQFDVFQFDVFQGYKVHLCVL